ncbi:DUF3299 domain-containing protein [Alphaproteobacteria bacterium KMM 3653]|uniref:DUF3299 domain-containing protein n=1 Tax=Harenicola maris TaxID=2841044 RepID=A0AAP2CPR7_9RHOB|nr:DUF3299 domain-containing protein [Harenicola maris]
MLTRRSTLSLLSAAALTPRAAFAASAVEIMWEDLIPPGVPYSEIIGEGELDEINDTWNPIYDENGVKFNPNLDGAYIRMPGYVIPLDVSAEGVTRFILAPYVGACIHTPPPPANQLVMVDTVNPWPGDALWDPVWVTGRMQANLQSTELGQTGYHITATSMTVYVW